jgi:hypothetical protein
VRLLVLGLHLRHFPCNGRCPPYVRAAGLLRLSPQLLLPLRVHRALQRRGHERAVKRRARRPVRLLAFRFVLAGFVLPLANFNQALMLLRKFALSSEPAMKCFTDAVLWLNSEPQFSVIQSAIFCAESFAGFPAP